MTTQKQINRVLEHCMKQESIKMVKKYFCHRCGLRYYFPYCPVCNTKNAFISARDKEGNSKIPVVLEVTLKKYAELNYISHMQQKPISDILSDMVEKCVKEFTNEN